MIDIEHNDIKQILDGHGIKSLDEIEVGEPIYDSLYDYYVDSGEMPYGTMKARDGDPHLCEESAIVCNHVRCERFWLAVIFEDPFRKCITPDICM